MSDRMKPIRRTCACVVYRSLFYALASTPVWGAIVVFAAICRHPHLWS